ncbi:MAG: adenosine kinase [Candidatus ainarchaeum sp.]|nr:adenosine kinase [Candidatus ainarchaeum sp.]
MEKNEFDVVGFGNSVLDIMVNVDDQMLDEFNLIKGNFKLINDDESKFFNEFLKDKKVIKSPGGSVSNTIAGVAVLGGKTAYIGGIGDDEYGEFYKKEMLKLGVTDFFIKKKGALTGQCLTFITTDGERSFAVNLGKSNYISPNEINYNFKTKIMHIEGYKLEHEIDFFTAKKLVEYSHMIGAKVSLDVNDVGVINRLGEKLKNFLKDIDILFMNENEAKALTGFSDERALNEMEKSCEIVILKLGEKGSIIRANKKNYNIAPVFVKNMVNTNGAGDAYQAAFLYGLSKNLDFEKIGKIASIFSADIVRRNEARFENLDNLSEEIKGLLH